METQADGTTRPNPNDYRKAQTNLIDPNCPQASFQALRDRCPAFVSEGIAYLTLHEDVESALRDPEVFGSRNRGVVGNVRPRIPVDIDPPEHHRYRRILDPLFAPREVARFEPEFAALANRLIDVFIDRGRCDFVSDFAVPLPSLMFLSLLGLPLEDLPVLLELNDAVMRPPSDGDVAQQLADSGRRIYEYFEDHLSRRGDHRGHDVISRILDAEHEGEVLTHDEVVDILYMFVLAGLDTVTSSLDCFVAYLAQHPEQRRRLVADPGLIPTAVEELLRWESPVSFSARNATREVTVSGCEIKKGMPVAIMLGSANTDERAVDHPDVVDFTRNPNRHMAFGRGIHRCLGSHLARLELKVALAVLHRRIPEYEIESGTTLEWRSISIRSLARLPLVFR